MSKQSITEMSDQLDAVFDEIIASGSDDELFASGYLRGHFDLVVARLTMAGIEDQEKFWPELKFNLENHADELKPDDIALVTAMMERLERAAV
ncbi:MAG: YfcL family protein [Idiomarina sp.]|nr:YfcL family protein [Idiomarina sp.]